MNKENLSPFYKISLIEQEIKSRNVNYKGIRIPQLQVGDPILLENLDSFNNFTTYITQNGYSENDIIDIIKSENNNEASIVIELNIKPLLKHCRRVIYERIMNHRKVIQ